MTTTTDETPKKSKSDTQIVPTTKITSFSTSSVEFNQSKELNKSSTFPPFNKSLEQSFNRSFTASSYSTPKRLTKVDLASPCSPVSPIYKENHSFSGGRKHAEKSLCLGDFMVIGGSKTASSGKKRSQRFSGEELPRQNCRRINPTNMNGKTVSGGFLGTENSFDFKTDFKELDVENREEQRSLLVQETQKV